MSKFTPGPWHTGGTGFVAGKPLVSIWGPTPEGKQSGEWIAKDVSPANARLIVKAPEMLAELKDIASFAREEGCLLGPPGKIESIEALISSVEGEPR